MSKLENDILNHSPSSQFVQFWRKYVDDIICVWDGTEPDLSGFFDELNAYHPSMDFTLEVGDDEINFLDLKLRLKEVNSHQKASTFNIHRKEGFTGVSINGSSLHPQSHKLATVNAAIHRLISLPLTNEAIETETVQIEKIAQLNELKINVRSMIRRKKLRSLLSYSRNEIPTGTKQRDRWVRLPYLGKPSENLAKLLRQRGYKPAFYPLSTLRDLIALKTPIPKNRQSGIYKLNCPDCPASYIGQTGRPLEVRIREHQSVSVPLSAMAKHCVDNNHNLKEMKTSLIIPCTKGMNMNCLEEVETILAYKKEKNFLLNDLTATFTHPIIRFYLNYSCDQDQT